VKSKNGFAIKGYTDCFYMFYEIWGKKDYDIPGINLTKGMTVVDIGANQGFFSLYAASKGATVYAFEPCIENFEVLKWNVETNGLCDAVKIFNVAVTGKQGDVQLFVGLDANGQVLSGNPSTGSANRTGENVQARSVESVTLDSLLHDFRIQRCDFIKMDCEGAEYDILRNASRESFGKIEAISMECHDNRMREAVTILKSAAFDILHERHGETGILKAVKQCRA
jgi:FkbM family methyltransferase